MTLTAKCTACGRKSIRMRGASAVATTVHTITCKCGARFRLVARPLPTRQPGVVVHLVDGAPLKPRAPRSL